MFERIKVTRKEVDVLARATFPEYKGRKFSVIAAEQVTLHDVNWGGGSRNQYRAVTLEGQPLGSTDRFSQMWPGSHAAEGMTLPIPQGAVVVEHCIFCGKDLGLRFYINPADMPKYLPAPK